MANTIMTIIGGVTQEVNVAEAKNGKMARINVGVNKSYPKQDESMYFSVTAFGQAAEFAAKNIKKGSRVMITGEFNTDDWVDKNGVKKTSLNITAYNVSFAPGGEYSRKTDSDNVVSRSNKVNYDAAANQEGLPF